MIFLPGSVWISITSLLYTCKTSHYSRQLGNILWNSKKSAQWIRQRTAGGEIRWRIRVVCEGIWVCYKLGAKKLDLWVSQPELISLLAGEKKGGSFRKHIYTVQEECYSFWPLWFLNHPQSTCLQNWSQVGCLTFLPLATSVLSVEERVFLLSIKLNWIAKICAYPLWHKLRAQWQV